MTHSSPDGDKFFDCVSNVKYCAVASPRGVKAGEVFLDFTEAHDKLKQIKGSRMKLFDDYARAQNFAKTPVEVVPLGTVYPPSPKADVESTPFPTVSQGQLARFRGLIENGDLEQIKSSVNENPLFLVTPSDTPTLLQIRLRYNALHVAAASGGLETLELLLNCLNSGDFWKRIYPGTDEHTARERQWRVIDLYLNSPELGNLETPLHFASKFGHVACTRLLACHPFVQLHLHNRHNQTPIALAACRSREVGTREGDSSTISETPLRLAVLSNAIRRVLDENFVVLAETNPSRLDQLPTICILPPLSLLQLQSLFAMVVCRTLPGLFSLLPFLSMAISFCDFSKTAVQSAFGAPGTLRSVRAFAGPLLSPDAHSFRSKWLKVNSSSSYKEFASVRLSDPDKGYERQGRFIARVFGTQWFEYWDFLDDYLDLSSEHGLSVLDERLRKDMSPGNKLWCCLEQDNAKCLRDVDSRTVLKFETASPSTPISRQVVHLPDNTNSQWHTYRSHPICATLLDDSLDASGDTPSPRALSNDEVRVAQNEVTETTNTLSPLLGLLRKLTFASPLRWLLVDGPGNSEPIFDPQSALPPHKKPVKMSTPVIDATRHSVKRRLSAVDRNQPPLEHTEQPAVKKSSPSGKASIRKSCFVPPLLKHIYRALPSGDPELEKAVMAVSSNKHDGDSVSLFSESQIGCFHYANLSNFHTVVAWRERMEAFIHFPRRHM